MARRRWSTNGCLDAVLDFVGEHERLPRPTDMVKAVPDRRPCLGTFYRYFQVRDWREPHGVVAAVVAAAPYLPPRIILSERNAWVRRMLMEAYGTDRLIKAEGELLGSDDFGKLWRLELGEDEPLVMVEVLNSTPEPDGTFKDYWLRVPPATATPRQAVAWTFDVEPDHYELAVQT